ncbi:MAG: TraR/DksA family transcriptional regulator [Thermoanaerobaculia bacterium]
MVTFTAEELKHFHDELVTAKEAAETVLRQKTQSDSPIERSGSAIGRLSRMDAIQVQAMQEMGHRQLEIRLKQIEQALAAIDQGKYGICRGCKEPIGIKRLEAVPEAPFCVDCQEGFER